ncbi:MAG: hypothetical protein ACK5LT_01535 [Lachnospirales bacterium]
MLILFFMGIKDENLSFILSVVGIEKEVYFASSDLKEYYEYNGVKFDNSIKKSEVEKIPSDVLKTMQKSNGIIKSLSKSSGDVLARTMPSTDFEMYVWSEELYKYSYEKFSKWKFYAQGSWIVNPNFEFTDVIALS